MNQGYHIYYEVWWQGADNEWRKCRTGKRADRALDYVRRLHFEFPDVAIRVLKRWEIRHLMWEWKPENRAEQFPQVTKLEQLEINDGTKTEDSESADDGGLRADGEPDGSDPASGDRDGDEGPGDPGLHEEGMEEAK